MPIEKAKIVSKGAPKGERKVKKPDPQFNKQDTNPSPVPWSDEHAGKGGRYVIDEHGNRRKIDG